MIYAVVRRYLTPEERPVSWLLKPNDFYAIYEKVFYLTDGDHEIAENVASWCSVASIGELYTFREGEVEITEIL